MKNARSVFSKVHIQKSTEASSNDTNHMCEICGKFTSRYIMEQHHPKSKWTCVIYRRDMYSQHNLLKHNEKPCENFHVRNV